MARRRPEDRRSLEDADGGEMIGVPGPESRFPFPITDQPPGSIGIPGEEPRMPFPEAPPLPQGPEGRGVSPPRERADLPRMVPRRPAVAERQTPQATPNMPSQPTPIASQPPNPIANAGGGPLTPRAPMTGGGMAPGQARTPMLGQASVGLRGGAEGKFGGGLGLTTDEGMTPASLVRTLRQMMQQGG